MSRASRRGLLVVCCLALALLVLYQLNTGGHYCKTSAVIDTKAELLKELQMSGAPVDRNMPLIFIGGVPRSGTTLARAMLDAHPLVRCGEETRVIPRILSLRSHWKKSAKETLRLSEAGLNDDVLDSAISAFILEVVVRHGEPAQRLCNKDPFTIKSATYLHQLFPRAKFVFMVRDGRATVHSIVSRKVTITGFDLTSPRQCLRRWNTVVDTMDRQCQELGRRWCMRVPYEQLVLEPRRWMERLLHFLEVPWNDTVLHHERTINKPGGVSLSKVEKSSDQVVRPVNTDALTKWVDEFPEDVVRDMAELAPMLEALGYDPNANPPDYRRLHLDDDAQEAEGS
ncbi:protein-tyrosine sulfotransferase-like isoform X1 [Pollicipes pollicipes]|uniref:protein-tyrosine sulfotransferase-like isoform X1 n=1 Tax=Pollicipes pollicipes TaxID=41117 RepID=UPI00188513FD|nr:protein-tyrosine sulfotransferase-like isoform X1 [Pollicipes pollicipes]XP_037077605.1 protein-tyrosine sulfotransferase-like isoform X1 [Pollicipes pollicipes]XP_037077606.1 protein-tyrosine sulfotransferase-like isoform X1 [Pollicipes pollicipes]